jgi:Kef-type K+ transport system membrane component KefB/nucleotide-binding universal stress UspA family protein
MLSLAASTGGGGSYDLLLLQMALLLLVARLGGELAKRLSLPAVVGELAAGIVLGPTFFGHYFPDQFASVFPAVPQQFRMLDTVATVGMVLLLLLTGLETDVRLLRNLGRPALISSLFGMVLPFGLGFGLGMIMPDEYLAGERVLFSFFLATAMSISAMPVIAKILMDLDLTKRNIGLVILSAGVVDDTTGWLILSVIAGVAQTGSPDLEQLARTLAWTLGFVAGAAFVLWPTLRFLMRMATDRFRTKDADLVLIVVTTLGCASLTEWIGIHAVFGAFIAGVIMRQVPRLNVDTVHKLESVTMAVFAPVFFGVVGLKVNLWQLHGAGMFFLVLGVASVSKLVGCTAGARWGGLGIWESLSIAVAMNARGAMELVVASIGLSLGILNQPMFSIIVMVAIVTSFMAPLGLRLTMRRVRLTEDERERLLQEQAKGFFDPQKLRVLVPTAGGPNTLPAARVAFTVTRGQPGAMSIMYVDSHSTWWDRLLHRLRIRRMLAGQGLEEHFAAIRSAAGQGQHPTFTRVSDRDVAPAIVAEASRGYDLVMIGASHFDSRTRAGLLEELVESVPCHLAVMRQVGEVGPAFEHLLVPVDGSVFSRAAVDFAVLYAEKTGARLTLLFVSERRPHAIAYVDEVSTLVDPSVPVELDDPITGRYANPDGMDSQPGNPAVLLERVSNVFKATKVQPTILHRTYDPVRSAVAEEAATGRYDLIVVGAENRAIRHRSFFGYENERLLREAPVSLLMVVPRIAARATTHS